MLFTRRRHSDFNVLAECRQEIDQSANGEVSNFPTLSAFSSVNQLFRKRTASTVWQSIGEMGDASGMDGSAQSSSWGWEAGIR